MRVGKLGQDLWPRCRDLGVAAIMYPSLADTNLALHAQFEPAKEWAKLKPTQKASLSRVAYEIAKGDTIYVKCGPRIVARGIAQSGYRFDDAGSIVDQYGQVWRHQVPVKWEPEFVPVRALLGGEQVTVRKLSHQQILAIEKTQHLSPKAPDIDQEFSAFEGQARQEFRTHRKRESALREAKLAAFIRDHDRIYCEVPECGFDFEVAYGPLGKEYAQVHHNVPLAESGDGRRSRIEDLAVLCANCHAMIHRNGECRTLSAISRAMQTARGAN